MPLTLTTPVSETITVSENKEVKDFKLINIFIRIEKERIDLVYKKGYDDGEGGITYADTEYMVSFANSDIITDYTDLVGRNSSVYASLKSASYDELKTKLSVAGTVY